MSRIHRNAAKRSPRTKAGAEPEPRRRWPIVLLVILLACAGGWRYWQRVNGPAARLAAARATARYDLAAAERRTAEAIARAGGDFPAAQLFHAELLLALGRPDEALGQFSLIEEPMRLPPDSLCGLARAALAQGETLLATQAFQAVASDATEFPQAQRALIQLHLRTGREEEAAEECRRLLEREPTDALAWQILGTLAMGRQDLTGAEYAFRQSLTHDDDAARMRDVREDLIQVLIDRGDAAAARAELQALREGPAPPSGRSLIEEAYILRLEGVPRRGIEILEPLTAGEGDLNLRSLLLRGLLYLDAGDDASGAADLERVVAAQPWNKEAHHKLGIAYRRLGRTAEAEKHLAAAARLVELAEKLLNGASELTRDPTNVALRQRVAELYGQLGRPDEARRLLGGQTRGAVE